LQCADILLYKANAVPVGNDQLPHLELAREIMRRFHFLYNCEIFPEPEAILTESARILGTDRRKMSKSYGNDISIDEEPDVLYKKVMSMITDESRVKLSDPGHPDICNVFTYYGIFAKDKQCEVKDWCMNAKKGCTECKKIMAEAMTEYLRPIREKKQQLMADKSYLSGIIKRDTQKARDRAQETLKEVRGLVRI